LLKLITHLISKFNIIAISEPKVLIEIL